MHNKVNTNFKLFSIFECAERRQTNASVTTGAPLKQGSNARLWEAVWVSSKPGLLAERLVWNQIVGSCRQTNPKMNPKNNQKKRPTGAEEELRAQGSAWKVNKIKTMEFCPVTSSRRRIPTVERRSFTSWKMGHLWAGAFLAYNVII